MSSRQPASWHVYALLGCRGNRQSLIDRSSLAPAPPLPRDDLIAQPSPRRNKQDPPGAHDKGLDSFRGKSRGPAVNPQITERAPGDREKLHMFGLVLML